MKKVVSVLLISLVIASLGFVYGVQKEMLIYPGNAVNGEFVEQEFQFERGWNLVHGILNPDWININSENIKAIYAFNPLSQEYVRFYPEPEKNQIGETNYRWESLASIGALWVYSDKSFKATYWRLEEFPIESISLFGGWNFMAFTPEMSGQTFNQIKGDCNIEDIYLWNSVGQGWSDEVSPKKQSSNLDKPIDDDFEGYGFIIKVTNDCKFGTSGGSSTPPSLPGTDNLNDCVDSDGGLNYNTKGILSVEGKNYEDKCMDSNFVTEYFCDNPPSYYDNYYCQNGCLNGACL